MTWGPDLLLQSSQKPPQPGGSLLTPEMTRRHRDAPPDPQAPEPARVHSAPDHCRDEQLWRSLQGPCAMPSLSLGTGRVVDLPPTQGPLGRQDFGFC